MNYFYKYKVPNFETHKKIIIDLIRKIPENYLNDNSQKIKHTDWSLPPTMKRDYLEYVYNNILPDYGEFLLNELKFKKMEIIKLWFQIYGKNDFHTKHNHGHAHFTNIFYLKLSNSTKTNIFDVKNNKILFDVTEGDIVSFPAFLYHESPINKYDEEKIIISFNTDFL